MSDGKMLALIVLVIAGYSMYLQSQGRLVPLIRFATGQTGRT